MTTHAVHDCGLPYRDCRCGHKHGDGCVGIVDPDVYDGVLWWICDDNVARPRFNGGSPRGVAAQVAADEYNGKGL